MEFGGVMPIDLGVTRDGRFAQRLAAVARAALTLGAKLRGVAKPDLIIGRNLEMLALANRAKALFSGDMPIVYECLDIHRLLLAQDGVGKAMRAAERLLGRSSVLLMTSSPAFVARVFRAVPPIQRAGGAAAEQGAGDRRQTRRRPATGGAAGRWRGLEDRLVRRPALPQVAGAARPLSPAQMDGRFEIVLRGRPAYSEFDDFDRLVAAEPYIHFAGPYRNPEDLAANLRRGAFLLGDRLLRGRPELQMAAAEPAL